MQSIWLPTIQAQLHGEEKPYALVARLHAAPARWG